jgi:hypothetical protein
MQTRQQLGCLVSDRQVRQRPPAFLVTSITFERDFLKSRSSEIAGMG